MVTSFRLTENLRGRYRDFPYTILSPHMHSLPHSTSPTRVGHLLQFTNLHIIAQGPWFTLGSLLVLYILCMLTNV